MSRVITFSKTFPAYHPKAGQPTHFVEKLWKCFGINALEDFTPKCHTIRAGHRWKVGDKFSPRVWSGKPYRSPQIIFSKDIEIKKVWDFEIKPTEKYARYYVNGKEMVCTDFAKLAMNDGLDPGDFEDWFQYKAMQGQIICWDENISY